MFKGLRRLKGAGLYHHIYNRGNDRHPIFKKIVDYKKYLKYLYDYSTKYKIDIVSYALLEQHIHLFIYDRAAKISEFIERLHGNYARIYNKTYGRTGHVFGSRFKNKIVDVNSYGIWLSRYIHCQAVEAGLSNKPEDYQWTSYRTYIGMDRNFFIKSDVILYQFGDTIKERIASYKEFVEGNNEGPVDWRKIELNPQNIVGNEKFIEEINLRLTKRKLAEPARKDFLGLICLRLNISVDELHYPQSKEGRKLRKTAIILLKEEYKLGVREIAKTLGISPALVSLILNDKWQ